MKKRQVLLVMKIKDSILKLGTNNNEESDTISDQERSFKTSQGGTSPSTGRRKSVVTFNENTEVFQFTPRKK